MKSGSYVVSQTFLELPNRFIEGDSYTCSVQFDRLIDPQWDEKIQYFYRYFLPIKSERWLSFIEHIPCYQDDDIPSTYDSYRCVGGIRVDLSKERQIHLFSVYMGASLFLAIESQFPCTYGEMSDYMHTISLSLGLVTSVAPFDYAYIVASETPDFEGKIMSGMIRLRPTIRVQYKLQFSAPIKEKDFAKLVLMLHRNKNLARATMMLLVASLDIDNMGPTYSVVLETICSVLCKENKDFFKPFLVEKGWGSDFKKNGEKLTKPFELQQIAYELSDAEKKIIKTRNNFLHGGITEEGKESMEKLLYIGMELRKLCGILLLRYSGYKGPILNNAVEMGLKGAIANKEPLFITYDEEAAKELVKKWKKEKQKEEEKKKKQSQGKNNKQSQGKNSTRKNQGKEKSPQPTKEPEASV